MHIFDTSSCCVIAVVAADHINKDNFSCWRDDQCDIYLFNNVLCELMLSLNAGKTANWIMLNLINASEFRKLHEV